jgi:hypothetical protein
MRLKGIPLIKIKKNIYIHRVYQLGWFRFSYYRLGKKFTLRVEISKGWDN